MNFNPERMFSTNEAVPAKDGESFRNLLDRFNGAVASVDTSNEQYISYRNREGFATDDAKISEIKVWAPGPDAEDTSIALGILPEISKSLDIEHAVLEEMSVEQLRMALTAKIDQLESAELD